MALRIPTQPVWSSSMENRRCGPDERFLCASIDADHAFTMRVQWWLFGGLVGGIVALPRATEACSCGFEYLLFPEDGALGLPTNLRSWTTYDRSASGEMPC